MDGRDVGNDALDEGESGVGLGKGEDFGGHGAI
jgi:hypothetical protein